MRRSSAPSKLNRGNLLSFTPFLKKQATKKPRDLPLEVGNNSDVPVQPKPSKIPKSDDITVDEHGTNIARSTADILKLLHQTAETNSDKNTATNKILVTNFSPSSPPSTHPLTGLETTGSDKITSEDQETCYFNVMWCKLSTKKHKKWEGDAILKIISRSATLVDMEGKVISRGSGYSLKQLAELVEGSMLTIGGKECEIQSIVTKEEFASGACFIEETQSKTVEVGSKPIPLKSFSNPMRNIPKGSISCRKPLVSVQPRYSATTPNALVLPRPNKAHQWENNTNGLPVIDVVVDPQIVKHLRPHQREGIIFLYKCVMGMQGYQGTGAILADEMGLGKTLQCIALIWTLVKQDPYGGQPTIKNVIIITPSSLVKNWLQEFKKWLGTEKLSIYAVDQKNTVNNFISSRLHSVLIISYEMFTRSAELLSKRKFDLLICDEGHRLKNSNIKTSNVISQLNTARRIILTGTPIQNDLQELFSIIDFCNPGILGSSSSFRQIFETPILESQRPGCSEEQKELGKSRADKLNFITSQFVFRRTQEVINKYIPPKTENVVFCKPTSLQVEVYNKILNSKALNSCLTSFHSGTGAKGTDHLTCISALKKLCNHPYLLQKDITNKSCDESEYEERDPMLYSQIEAVFPPNYDNLKELELINDSGKLSVLSSMLAELHQTVPKEKIVVASNYTQTLGLIEELCCRDNYPFLRLDGSTPSSKRQDLVNSFNNKHSPHFVFLLSMKAGGVGLNLIGASRIVLYDIDWNPATDLQAQARVWRDGQTKNVHCYRLITTGTIEEKIYQRQIDKQCLSTVVMDSKESSKIKFSVEILKNLFTFTGDSLSTTHDTLKCSCQSDQQTEKENHVSAEEEELGPYRIAVRKQQESKSQGMSELLHWRHIPAPLSFEMVQDTCLLAATQYITFLFQNEAVSYSD